MLAAAVGYLATAQALLARLETSVAIWFLLLVVYHIIRRWMLIQRRRLAFDRARHRRAEILAQRARGEDEPVHVSSPEGSVETEVSEVDLDAISTQSLRLVRSLLMLIALLSVIVLWSEIHSAFGFLENISLWDVTSTVQGVESLEPITLGAVLIAILVLIITTQLVRNLPALAERLLGAQGLQLIAVLIGVCVPLFNVGAVWPMTRHAQRGFMGEIVRNPLIIATASGLVANLLGFSIPEFLAPTVTRIGAASIALGLMAAGAGMQFQSLARGKLLGASVLTIRHLLSPVIAWLLARAFRLGAAETTVLLTFAALPTASSCYVLAARMGYNGPYVAGLVTLSTVLGVALASGG